MTAGVAGLTIRGDRDREPSLGGLATQARGALQEGLQLQAPRCAISVPRGVEVMLENGGIGGFRRGRVRTSRC